MEVVGQRGFTLYSSYLSCVILLWLPFYIRKFSKYSKTSLNPPTVGPNLGGPFREVS